MISNSLRACYVAQSLVIGADEKVDGELKVRARGRVGGGAWTMLDHVVDLPLRVGCRLQRHSPVPSVSQLSQD